MDLEKLSLDSAYIQSFLDNGKSHKYISCHLQSLYPNVRGLSERSVRRYCIKHNIQRLNGPELDRRVSNAIQEVGPTYGVKTMLGYLDANGLKIGRVRLRNSLRRSHPDFHERRRNDTARQTNPVPYYAAYFGHKLHVDQNEKLVAFGVTHVLFIDGFSRKIVKSVIMPIKNPIVIYKVYREILLEFGIWDMLRIDHGREFCLMNFVQNKLRDYRNFRDCPAYVQSRSRENLRAERAWPEVNQRTNYDIKAALISMQRRMLINMYNETEKFCVSFIACNVAQVGLQRFVPAWNRHPLEGFNSRVPDVLARGNNRIARLTDDVIPSVDDAVIMYERAGGSLTRESRFGDDPLKDDQHKISRREQLHHQQAHSFEYIFGRLVNGDCEPFETAIVSFITLHFP
ncbi:uncharacterized protein [Ptychodera flava]|uniref:uncharacterized protein n=1 Tax=Ptychodera flava TaxID=63121 RepID=UPI00396AA728